MFRRPKVMKIAFRRKKYSIKIRPSEVGDSKIQNKIVAEVPTLDQVTGTGTT